MKNKNAQIKDILLNTYIVFCILIIIIICFISSQALTISIFIILSLCFYFIPSIIAFWTKCKNTNAILILNLLLGWTVIGWIGALIWTVCEGHKEEKEEHHIGKYCHKCGKSIKKESKFCNHCGAEI